MAPWNCVLELDSQRQQVEGDVHELQTAIQNGADLRIGTAFRHNEHIDTNSECKELIQEVMDFRVTYLINQHWVAGIENLRMPISLPDGFGPRASMSFFLYNQDGHQAIARPHLDGQFGNGQRGPSPVDEHLEMPKYHELASWDAETNAPSSNFIYDFEYFKYYVREGWEEVLSHDENWRSSIRIIQRLRRSHRNGCEMKVAIHDLCSDLTDSQKGH